MQSLITHEDCVRSTFITCLQPTWVLTCWTIWGVVLCCWTGSAQHFIFTVRLILWTVHPEDEGTLIILNIATTHPMTQCYIWQSSVCLWEPLSTHSVSFVDSHHVTMYINAHYCNAILVPHCSEAACNYWKHEQILETGQWCHCWRHGKGSAGKTCVCHGIRTNTTFTCIQSDPPFIIFGFQEIPQQRKFYLSAWSYSKCHLSDTEYSRNQNSSKCLGIILKKYTLVE